MDRTEHRFSPSGRLPGGDFRVRRQSCQQDGAEQQRERAAPPGHVCASAHGGVSGAQSRFAGADCPAGQPCRPADCRARCPADRRVDCRVESVHVSPPLPLRQCMHCGAFSCGRGDCPAGACLAGACPPPCRLTVPLWCPQGGLSGWSSADRAVPEAARGACLVCRLPTMPLVYFLSPIPPAPFPSGEGGDHKFISPGASPPAPLH